MACIKFRRQQPIPPYIIDFVSFEKKIIIEVDGDSHGTEKKYDDTRDEFFKKQGYIVLRFWNEDIIKNTEGVYQVILEKLNLNTPPLTPPTGGGEI